MRLIFQNVVCYTRLMVLNFFLCEETLLHNLFRNCFSLLLVFLPTKLSVLLNMIFFTGLKTTKITSKILISKVCDRSVTLVMWHSFINMLFISTVIFYDKLCPQILSVGTTANAEIIWNLYTIKGKAKIDFGLHHFFWFWSYAPHFAKKYLFILAGSRCFCVLLTYSSMLFFLLFI